MKGFLDAYSEWLEQTPYGEGKVKRFIEYDPTTGKPYEVIVSSANMDLESTLHTMDKFFQAHTLMERISRKVGELTEGFTEKQMKQVVERMRPIQELPYEVAQEISNEFLKSQKLDDFFKYMDRRIKEYKRKTESK